MQIDLSGKYWFSVGVMWIFFGGGIAHLALVDPKLWLGTMAWIVSATMAAGGAALCWVARKGRSMKKHSCFLCVVFCVFLCCGCANAKPPLDMESINIAKIEELSETGKAVFCTYKGKRYRVVGIAKDMIGQLYRTGIVGNHPVFIQKGESAFFNVRADLISDINTTR